jgi:predicted GNAT family acetyltransferase
MAEIKFESGGGDPDAFNLYDHGEKIGEMIVEVKNSTIKVYHTEVDEDQSGKGHAESLLTAMAAYAREHGLKVIPLCSYVAAQFKRHPDIYGDIWNKDIEPTF